MPKRSLRPISLTFGGDAPLVLSPQPDALLADCRGPEGSASTAVSDLVMQAITEPSAGPPLATHVVPGDRVVIAVAGEIPQAHDVVTAVHRCLETAGVAPADIVTLHDEPATDAETAYLAADDAGMPLYLSRALIDADVVVSIGSWSWDAALGGRSIEGELWPTFSRPGSRQGLVRDMAKRGRRALAGWRGDMQAIVWQLGVCANLRLVAGRDGTLATAVFGLPESAGKQARQQAAAWRPHVRRESLLTIATVSHPLGKEPPAVESLAPITRAVAAAARVTQPDGTICLACRLATPPGVIFSRWRQGAPLEGLVHEALSTDDPALVADALQTRLFARALGDRRLVLLSDLDETTVEELEFGHAGSPAAIERLAAKAESLIVLHEADRMFPRLA